MQVREFQQGPAQRRQNQVLRIPALQKVTKGRCYLAPLGVGIGCAEKRGRLGIQPLVPVGVDGSTYAMRRRRSYAVRHGPEDADDICICAGHCLESFGLSLGPDDQAA